MADISFKTTSGTKRALAELANSDGVFGAVEAVTDKMAARAVANGAKYAKADTQKGAKRVHGRVVSNPHHPYKGAAKERLDDYRQALQDARDSMAVTV